MSKHSGSRYWPVTEGNWEVSSILHIDEDTESIFFMANKESVSEERFYSISFDGTDLKILTPENGNHRIEISGSKKYFIDRYSSLKTPRKILLKELYSGNLVRVLGETDIEQFIEYEWSNPKIIHFPSKDGQYELDGLITLPPNYTTEKKYPVIMYGYGMPGTQIVWNQWGGGMESISCTAGLYCFFYGCSWNEWQR